jgi:hypothetical protein
MTIFLEKHLRLALVMRSTPVNSKNMAMTSHLHRRQSNLSMLPPESARRFYSLTIALTFANASLVTDALAFSAKRMPLAEKSIIFTC